MKTKSSTRSKKSTRPIAIKKLEEEVAQAKADEAARGRPDQPPLQPGYQSRLAELQSAIANAEARLPENIVAPYRRLVQAYGAAALAEVEAGGTACSSCYVNLPAQMVMQVRAGEVLFCKVCGRLLYMRPGTSAESRIGR